MSRSLKAFSPSLIFLSRSTRSAGVTGVVPSSSSFPCPLTPPCQDSVEESYWHQHHASTHLHHSTISRGIPCHGSTWCSRDLMALFFLPLKLLSAVIRRCSGLLSGDWVLRTPIAPLRTFPFSLAFSPCRLRRRSLFCLLCLIEPLAPQLPLHSLQRQDRRGEGLFCLHCDDPAGKHGYKGSFTHEMPKTIPPFAIYTGLP